MTLEQALNPRNLAIAGSLAVFIGLAFLSLVAATRLYDLIDPTTALLLSGLIALFGAFLGLRRREEVVSGSILAAALISPLMFHQPVEPAQDCCLRTYRLVSAFPPPSQPCERHS